MRPLIAVVLSGVLPSLHATRVAPASRLRGARGGRAGSRVRSALGTAHLALAVVLLSVAGLLVRSFAGIASADPGFRVERMLSFLVRLPASYDLDATRMVYFDDVLERIRALPGVAGAGAVFRLPLASAGFSTRTVSVETARPPAVCSGRRARSAAGPRLARVRA